MAESYGDCARENCLRYDAATATADTLLSLFTNRIADIQQSSRNTMNTFYEVRASMLAPDITTPTLEAKQMELLSLVERLETSGNEVEALLQQVDVNIMGKLVRTLPMYRDFSDADGRCVVLDYLEDVRLKFSWLRPQSLAVKRKMVTVIRTRYEVC